jgi:hypothetical protein
MDLNNAESCIPATPKQQESQVRIVQTDDYAATFPNEEANCTELTIQDVEMENLEKSNQQTKSDDFVPKNDNSKKRKNDLDDPNNNPMTKRISTNRDDPQINMTHNLKKNENKMEIQDSPIATTSKSIEERKGVQQYPKTKPPPIVISTGSALEIRTIANNINKTPGSSTIEKGLKGILKVYMQNWPDHDALIKLLDDKMHKFYTYAKREAPQLKFVLYGLPDLQTEEISNALAAIKITPVKIAKMTMKRRQHSDDQNYLLYFPSEQRKGEQDRLLSLLQNIKCLVGFKVKWAKYESKRNGPAQCSKCLLFGHAESGCFREPTCFRCAGNHHSKECPMVNEDNRVPEKDLKCFFCQGQHTAIFQNCKARLQKIAEWNEKLNKRKAKLATKPVSQPKPAIQPKQAIQPKTAKHPKPANQLKSVNQPKPIAKSQPTSAVQHPKASVKQSTVQQRIKPAPKLQSNKASTSKQTPQAKTGKAHQKQKASGKQPKIQDSFKNITTIQQQKSVTEITNKNKANKVGDPTESAERNNNGDPKTSTTCFAQQSNNSPMETSTESEIPSISSSMDRGLQMFIDLLEHLKRDPDCLSRILNYAKAGMAESITNNYGL